MERWHPGEYLAQRLGLRVTDLYVLRLPVLNLAGKTSILEDCAALAQAFVGNDSGLDMWRVSPAGKATIIRNYWEDDAEWNKTLSVNRGSWLSPNMMARSLGGVRPARARLFGAVRRTDHCLLPMRLVRPRRS